MSDLLITSGSNPLVKRIRALIKDRRTREREDAFFCEGIQPVWRAFEGGARIETLVVSPELLVGSPGERLLAEAAQAGVPCAALSAELFQRLSGREGPAGVGAVIRRSHFRLDDVSVAPDSLFVALHETANPGNLGSIIRTADAAAARAVVLLGNGVDLYSPPVVKASMGSLFMLPVVADVAIDVFFTWAARHRISVMATSAHSEAPYDQIGFEPPLVILLGNEGRGLPQDLLSRADARVRIPMFGSASSLNLSVAAGIMLFAARRELGSPASQDESRRR